MSIYCSQAKCSPTKPAEIIISTENILTVIQIENTETLTYLHRYFKHTLSHTNKRNQKCMGEKSQWKWLWISRGLSYSILTQGGTGGLSGEAGLTWEGSSRDAALVGVHSALRREGRRVDTGGRTVVLLLLLLLLVCVWVCDERWESACEGTWSPRVKKEGGGWAVEEGGWWSRAPPKLAG